MSTAFYFVIDCDNCEEEILHGLNITTDEHNGHPVIPFDLASQTTFECQNCGCVMYTGDLMDQVEVDTDGIFDPEDDEEDDEDDAAEVAAG